MRFDSYHPAINLIYFVSVIAGTLCFLHPVFLALSYLCAFAYSVKLNGRRAAILNLCLIPLIVLWTLFYAAFNHFGVTNLHRNFIGNQLTLESIVYGGSIGGALAGVIMWLECMHAVFCTDKIVYLFGRVSPKLSLFLAIILRMVPRIGVQARSSQRARQCVGRGVRQGNILRRLKSFICIFSATLTWTAESMISISDSMRCRGYTLPHRTAFSIYRFDNRDRSFVIGLFACLSVLLAGMLLHQTRIYYNPRIILNRITPLSAVFYAAYFVLCMLPMALQIIGEIRSSIQNRA